MSNQNLIIDENSLKNELQNYKEKPYLSIFEYVWNAFDAHASEVDINYEIPESGIGYIDKLIIKDNGNGWNFDTTDTNTFLSSHKSDEKQKNKTLPHGRWGRGRYVFIWFADKLIVESKGSKLFLHKNIKIDKEKNDTDHITGTVVTLDNLSERMSSALLNTNIFEKEIILEYCWFLQQNSNFKIRMNGKIIVYDDIIKKNINYSKSDFSEELRNKLNQEINVNIILWNEKPREFAKFYFINQTTKQELFTKYTSLNKQKDDYWHSVYITSNLFTTDDTSELDSDENQQQLPFDKESLKIKRKLINEIRDKLVDLRKPLLVERSEIIIEELHANSTIPKLDNFGIIDTESFDDLLKQVFIIAPFLFIGKSKEEKTFLCSVLAGLLSSQDVNLINIILQQTLELTQDEQKDLLNILHRTSLSNIVKTIKEIDYRILLINDLEKLLFEYKKITLEVKHLQKILNVNTWVFGEQFRLFRNTEGALNKALFDYAKEILKIDNPEIITDSRKEVDLFLVKTQEENEIRKNNFIVEIKRPSIKLGKTEYDQIEEYALTIIKEPICNGENTNWEFYLIGDDYDDYIKFKIQQARNYGEESRGLTLNDNGKSKIYVRKWSDILHELSYKMKYLKDKLQLETNNYSITNPEEISKKYIENNK